MADVKLLTPGAAQAVQEHRLKFPGMLPRETLIWAEFLRQHGREWDRFDYNVRGGTGFDPGPGWPENQRRNAVMNTQKRFDVVGFKGNEVTIFEVKDRAGASAVGQLLTYCPIWEGEHPESSGCKLALVSNRLQPDIMPAIVRYKILLYQVVVDFSPLARNRRAAPFIAKSL